MDRPIDHEAMKKAIIEGAQKLESTGVSFIAMPCNTAHLYFEELQRSLAIPILNIVDETLQSIPENTKESLFSQQKQLFKPVFIKTGLQNGI